VLKDKVYSNNPCSEDDLKDSICDVTFLISLAELHCAMSNMFVRFVSMSWRKPFPE